MIKHKQMLLKKAVQSVTSTSGHECDDYVVENMMLLAIPSFHFGIITTI